MITINAARFKDVVKTIDKYESVINITFAQDGAYVLLNDSSNVSRCKIILKPEWFEIYRPEIPRIFLARKNLEHIAKMCTNESSIILTIDKDGKTVFANFFAGKINYKASFVKVSEASANEIRDISETALASFENVWNVYDIPSVDFAKCIDSLKLAYSEATYLSKAVKLTMSNSEMQLSAGDLMTDSGVIDCSIDIYIKKCMTESPTFEMEFSTDYIEIFRNQIMIYKSEMAEFRCSERVPVLLEIVGHEGTCIVRTLLAPRIAQD